MLEYILVNIQKKQVDYLIYLFFICLHNFFKSGSPNRAI